MLRPRPILKYRNILVRKQRPLRPTKPIQIHHSHHPKFYKQKPAKLPKVNNITSIFLDITVLTSVSVGLIYLFGYY